MSYRLKLLTVERNENLEIFTIILLIISKTETGKCGVKATLSFLFIEWRFSFG